MKFIVVEVSGFMIMIVGEILEELKVELCWNGELLINWLSKG